MSFRAAEAIEQERSSPDAFSQQPYYFMELACLLLEHAKSCFASNDEYMQVCGHECMSCQWSACIALRCNCRVHQGGAEVQVQGLPSLSIRGDTEHSAM